MGITVTQQDMDLVIEWTPVASSSNLTYTIVYDTVPPSDGSMLTIPEIRESNYRIHGNNLVLDRACSVGVRARDERTTFYGAWSYAESCNLNSMIRPEMPVIDLSYNHPLFELKWEPPVNPNGLIQEYIVRLKNETSSNDMGDCSDICDESTYELHIPIEPGITMYFQVINVTDDTCFCASVEARNGAGSSPRSFASHFYEYKPSIIYVTVPNTGSGAVTGGDGDDGNGVPLVAIVLAVVLVIILAVTVILAFVLYKLYNSQRKANPSDSSKNLYNHS